MCRLNEEIKGVDTLAARLYPWYSSLRVNHVVECCTQRDKYKPCLAQSFVNYGFSWKLLYNSLINQSTKSTWGEIWMFLTRLWTSFSVLHDKSLLAFMDLDQLSLVYKGFDYNWCFSSSFVTQCFVVKRFFFTFLCWQAILSLHLSFDYSFVQII